MSTLRTGEGGVLGFELVAERSKAWVCGRSLAGIAGLNPAGGMDICVCVVSKDKYRMQESEDKDTQVWMKHRV